MKNDERFEYVENERARFIEVFKNKMDCTLVKHLGQFYTFKSNATGCAFDAWIAAKDDIKEQSKV